MALNSLQLPLNDSDHTGTSKTPSLLRRYHFVVLLNSDHFPAPAFEEEEEVWEPGTGWSMLYDSLGFPHVQEVRLVTKFQSLPGPGGQEVPEFFWVTRTAVYWPSAYKQT